MTMIRSVLFSWIFIPPNPIQQLFKDYDCHNDKIRLKIVHTYGVVKESADIAARMKLSEEDTSLAKMIALLHDIGRFFFLNS